MRITERIGITGSILSDPKESSDEEPVRHLWNKTTPQYKEYHNKVIKQNGYGW